MKTQIWKGSFHERQITVVRTTSLLSLRCHHLLQVDDEVILEQTTNYLWDRFTTLFASIIVDGIARKVEVRFGKLFVKTGAQILIDNQWSGGDRWINYPEQAHLQYQKGFFNFLVSVGLLNYGLPYGIGMTMMQYMFRYQNLTFVELCVEFVFYTLFFGCGMGFFEWRSIRSIAESRKGFLNAP